MITTVCKISYGSQTVPPIVPAVQGDTGRAISFEIADFTPPAGATATYFILKPSGEAIYNSATITNNSILCELTAQSLAEAGENRMQVRVLQGEDIVTSFEVILMVRTFLGDDAIESGTEMNIFDQAVEHATEQFQENAEQIVEEVIESIPADYTELTDEVDELNERLSTKADVSDVTYYDEEDVAVSASPEGWRLDGTGKCVEDSSYKLVKYETTPGDTLHLVLSKDVTASEAEGVYQWQNAMGVPSQLPNTGLIGTPVTEAINGYVTVPTGATVLVVSQFKTNTTNKVMLVTGTETVKGKIEELDTDVTELDEKIDGIEPGLSSDAKAALLACIAHVKWSDERGQSYYDALESALYPSEYPLITAVFNAGSNVIYTDDTLNSLKQYLTVKYFETEESTGTVVPSANYTLSGALIEGTSTIYVAYNDLRTSFVINNVVNFYNIMERPVSDGLMSLRQGGVGQTSGGDAKIVDYTQNYPRYSTYVTRGKRGMLANDGTTLTNYYPIPVPSGATTAKIDITPNTQYFALQQFSYDESTEIYNKEKDSGWQISGTTIQLELDKNVKFATMNLKYNSAGTSYPVVPTDVKITFE